MKTFFITILLILMVSCGGEDTGNTGNTGNTGDTGNTGVTCTGSDKFCHSHDGLNWSDASSDDMNWADAITYCVDLGGRLPTISELRTLIQNCPATETGGECGVMDSCLSYEDCFDSCGGCGYDDSGKYSVFGDNHELQSSSERSDYVDSAWYVGFEYGNVGTSTKDSYHGGYPARCVRDSGNTGNTGDTGNSGNTGNSGDTADTGDSGDTGNSGNSGNSGNELLSAVYSSGSRLKVKYFESPDGAKVFRNLWDSQLNETCYFQYFSDGKYRCFPQSVCSLNETYYYDDNCKSSLTLVMCNKAYPKSKYVALSSAISVADGIATYPVEKVYEVGSAYSGKAFSLSGENCVDITDGLQNTGLNFYSLGGEVPFSTFQEGSIKTLE